MAAPGAPHRDLLPCLVDAQVGRVDETAQDEVREVSNKVIKRHPAEREELSLKKNLKREKKIDQFNESEAILSPNY